jgi:hypothetical protein
VTSLGLAILCLSPLGVLAYLVWAALKKPLVTPPRMAQTFCDIVGPDGLTSQDRAVMRAWRQG